MGGIGCHTLALFMPGVSVFVSVFVCARACAREYVCNHEANTLART